jgi:hypothetical protein
MELQALLGQKEKWSSRDEEKIERYISKGSGDSLA